MTIPLDISSDLASLQAQVAAASPLSKATHATITALQLNAAALLKKIRASLIAPDSVLDTWVADEDTLDIIAAIEGLVVAAEDANTLALMEGVVGRASSNLDQLT